MPDTEAFQFILLMDFTYSSRLRACIFQIAHLRVQADEKLNACGQCGFLSSKSSDRTHAPATVPEINIACSSIRSTIRPPEYHAVAYSVT